MNFIEDASAIERILIQRASQVRSPINGSIELTPICNMSCDMCYVRLTPKEVERQGRLRTVGEWLEITRQMRDAGTLFLLITGGEPLTYPDFKRLYLEIQKMGLLITINTNGTLIDEQWAAFFGEHKPRRINITLYGPDKETYASLCHHAEGFDKTVRAIQLLREQDVPVRVNISATPHNADHIDRMTAIARELGAAVLVDSYMLPATRERQMPFDKQARLLPEKAAEVRIHSLKERLSPEEFSRYVLENLWAVSHIHPEAAPHRMRCLAGSCSFAVNWQGEMRPCVILSQPSISVLNTGFEAAWRQLRAEVDQIVLSSRCSSCRLRTFCLTCAASAISETGRTDGMPEYMCLYSAHFLRLLTEHARQHIFPIQKQENVSLDDFKE